LVDELEPAGCGVTGRSVFAQDRQPGTGKSSWAMPIDGTANGLAAGLSMKRR
jgi:hypothetical protein